MGEKNICVKGRDQTKETNESILKEVTWIFIGKDFDAKT